MLKRYKTKIEQQTRHIVYGSDLRKLIKKEREMINKTLINSQQKYYSLYSSMKNPYKNLFLILSLFNVSTKQAVRRGVILVQITKESILNMHQYNIFVLSEHQMFAPKKLKQVSSSGNLIY
ncbi:hypothetical protein ABPG72_007981 [Tetrahymena utriculariae]